MPNIPLKEIPGANDLSSISAPQINNVNVPMVDFGGEKAAIAQAYNSVSRSYEAAGQSASKIGTANVLLEKPQASSKAPAVGVVTSYGYDGDSYGGPSAKATKTGAFNDNELTDQSLAVSPDIQARFKEAGIKPMEPVELTLEDGTKVVRHYDDHTATDQEARKLGLKPLRGRFDFRSVGGKQEKDGMRIVSFRKYSDDGQG